MNGSNDRKVDHQDYIGILNNVNEFNSNDPHLKGGIGVIRLPPAEGNMVFDITCDML